MTSRGATTLAATLSTRSFDEILRTAPPTLAAGAGVLADMTAFWRAAGPSRYFARSDEFDAALVSRYGDVFPAVHEERIRPSSPASTSTTAVKVEGKGEEEKERAEAEEYLGMVLLLDQYPRNAFRQQARQYASDPLARKWANAALQRGLDRRVEETLRTFFYLPFGHSESLHDQDRAVDLGQRVGGPYLAFAKEHRDVVARFGRFPHRNAVLGRETTEEEKRFLQNEAPMWARS